LKELRTLRAHRTNSPDGRRNSERVASWKNWNGSTQGSEQPWAEISERFQRSSPGDADGGKTSAESWATKIGMSPIKRTPPSLQ